MFFPQNISTLISKEQLSHRVKEMGQQITADFKGKPLTILVILKGSYIFASDLVRAIELPLNLEFMGLKSYGDSTTTSGVVQITSDVKHPLEGQNVLIVEDIVDSGLTINYLEKNLITRNPASICLAAMLHKPSRTKVHVNIDYLGFTIEDKFVVGYGMDYQGLYRNLPYIGVLEKIQ